MLRGKVKTNYFYARTRRVFGLDFGYIKRSRSIRLAGIISIVALATLSFFAISPITNKTEYADATATPATTTLDISTTSNVADVEVNLNNKDDSVFAASSSDITFDVATNNLTGYTLKMVDNGSAGKLINSDYNATLDTIASITDATTFATGAASTYVNKWGFKPNVYNSATNDRYVPAPTTSDGYTLNTTNCASGKGNCSASDTYNIGVGARVDYTKPAGEYMSTYTLVALANSISYQFKFLDTTSDSNVGDLPSTESGNSVSVSNYTLPTKTPTRTGYDFIGWCEGGTIKHVTSGDSTCEGGTVYAAGATYTSFTSSTTVNLYAMWSAKTYTINRQYRLQDTEGNYPTSYTSDSTGTVRHGATYTYTKAATTSHQAATKVTAAITTNNTTVSLDIPRKQYSVARQYSYQDVNGNYPDYTATTAVTVLHGASYTYSVAASTAHQAASASSGTVTGTGVTISLKIPRKQYSVARQYRYQNADGSYPAYTAATAVTVLHGASYTYSVAASTAHQAASASSGTVTGSGVTVSLTIPRKTYSVARQYRYQNADGSYPAYTAATAVTVLHGASYTYSVAASTAHQAASASSGTVTGSGVTVSLTIPRNTKKCIIRYQFENANDSNYGTSSVAVNTTKPYGNSTCSWSRAADATYNAGSYSNSSITADVDTTVKITRKKYTLTVSKGSNISSVSGGGSYKAGQSGIAIKATPTSTYRFSKWTATAGTVASATSTSTTFTMPSSAATVTAAATAVSFATAYSEAGKSKVTYNSSDYYTMQTMTTSICTNVTNGQTATLLDNRKAISSSDSTKYTYTVAKLNGKCWMTHDLRYINPSVPTSTSNVTEDKSLTYYDLTNKDKCGSGLEIDDGTAGVPDSIPGHRNTCIKDNSKGAWYNYAAATAGTIKGDEKETAASQDLCPKNWKIPTKSEGTSSIFNNSTTYVSAFKATGSALGTYRNGTLGNATKLATWWTSNKYTGDDWPEFLRNFLTYDSGTGKLDTEGGWHGRDAGKHVRCIAK